jgi:hypothetical protein
MVRMPRKATREELEAESRLVRWMIHDSVDHALFFPRRPRPFKRP